MGVLFSWTLSHDMMILSPSKTTLSRYPDYDSHVLLLPLRLLFLPPDICCVSTLPSLLLCELRPPSYVSCIESLQSTNTLFSKLCLLGSFRMMVVLVSTLPLQSGCQREWKRRVARKLQQT